MANGCVKSVTTESFEDEVLRHPGVVLVDYYTQWCPPCKLVVPILEELCVERQETLKIVKVDAGEHAAIAEGINAMPTFRLFRNGEKISQTVGYQSKAAFVRWIESAVN